MDILEERAEDYGDVNENFQCIATMWSALLGCDVSKAQVGLCMIALKVARENNRHKEDNVVDIAGYAELLNRLTGE